VRSIVVSEVSSVDVSSISEILPVVRSPPFIALSGKWFSTLPRPASTVG